MHNDLTRAARRTARRSDPAMAFLSEACVHTNVDLAEFLAEAFVASATSGDDVREDERDRTNAADV